MNSKQIRIVLGVVIVALLVVVGYMTMKSNSQKDTFGLQSTTQNSSSVNSNDNTETTQQSIKNNKEYSDKYLSFSYPNNLVVQTKTPKDPLPPEASYPCGVVWNDSIECLFLSPNLNSDYGIGMAIFQSGKSAMQWCQSDEFGEYDNCQVVKNGDNTVVTAGTPDSSSPKYTYTILSQNNKIVVAMNVNASTTDISTILNTLKVK